MFFFHTNRQNNDLKWLPKEEKYESSYQGQLRNYPWQQTILLRIGFS